jgi:hypothetical protein
MPQLYQLVGIVKRDCTDGWFFNEHDRFAIAYYPSSRLAGHNIAPKLRQNLIKGHRDKYSARFNVSHEGDRVVLKGNTAVALGVGDQVVFAQPEFA